MRKRKFISLLVAVMLICSCSVSVMADAGFDDTVSPVLNSFQIKNKKNRDTAFTITKEERVPGLKLFQVNTHRIFTPGTLSVDVTISGDKKWTTVSLYLENEKGKKKTLLWDKEGVLKPGKHRLYFPVSPFWGTGDWKITGVSLKGKSGETIIYQIGNKKNPLEKVKGYSSKKISVFSSYDIVYYGSVENVQTAIQKINEMKEGQTAVLDCRYSKIVRKALFQAIAGKNKTVVFEDKNIQWIFRGKGIQFSGCKDIDLNTIIKCVCGKKYGYLDDKYVLYMEYADNGMLLGMAKIRVNYDYLREKCGLGKHKLVLSYYDCGMAEIMSKSVKVAKDEYAEYEITHNSTYILSKNNPHLLAPSSVKAKGVSQKIKASYSKKVSCRIMSRQPKN